MIGRGGNRSWVYLKVYKHLVSDSNHVGEDFEETILSSQFLCQTWERRKLSQTIQPRIKQKETLNKLWTFFTMYVLKTTPDHCTTFPSFSSWMLWSTIHWRIKVLLNLLFLSQTSSSWSKLAWVADMTSMRKTWRGGRPCFCRYEVTVVMEFSPVRKGKYEIRRTSFCTANGFFTDH